MPGNAGYQSTPPKGDEYRIDMIQLFYQFNGNGTLAADDLNVVIGGYIRQPFLFSEFAGMRFGVGRIAAMEIMLNTPLIADLIFKGEVGQIKEIMAKSTRLGMQTFDQALFNLYEQGIISYEEAMRNADSKNELRLRVKLESKRDSSIADQQSESLKIVEEDTAQTF